MEWRFIEPSEENNWISEEGKKCAHKAQPITLRRGCLEAFAPTVAKQIKGSKEKKEKQRHSRFRFAYVVDIFMSAIKNYLCFAYLEQMSCRNSVITHLTSKKNISTEDNLGDELNVD